MAAIKTFQAILEVFRAIFRRNGRKFKFTGDFELQSGDISKKRAIFTSNRAKTKKPTKPSF
jgi:hypothetical protein